MKKLILSSFVALSMISSVAVLASSCSTETNSTSQLQSMTEETFKVYGNCGMCKQRIESSLKEVDGVEEAKWDVRTKMLSVKFDTNVISLQKINETIAESGHDSDSAKASNDVYNKLPSCCKYERA